MGWYQDNFPGSAAQKQRNRLSLYGLAYVLITGLFTYKFAPLLTRQRKEFAEGKEWADIEYFTRNRDALRHRQFIYKPDVSSEEFLDAHKAHEKVERGDVLGPELSDEEIRRKLRRF